MLWLARLYDVVLEYAKHRYAVRYLAFLSAAEAIFFPIPPDALLIPMTLSTPKRAWQLAMVTTLASVLGGVVGYGLGSTLFPTVVSPALQSLGYQTAYQEVVGWFTQWGFWVVLLAGFTPLPYKLFTIAAGVLGMPLILFVGASLLGRGLRFYAVAAVVRYLGLRFNDEIRRWVGQAGWWSLLLGSVCALLLGLYACTRVVPAQVIELQPEPQFSGTHLVRRGETLYAVAWRYGRDYRDLAQRNHIAPPYVLQPGQRLSLQAPTPSDKRKPVVHAPKKPKSVQRVQRARTKPVAPKKSSRLPKRVSRWVWPAQGRLIKGFSKSRSKRNNGIDIQGIYGSAVKAAAAGQVVYSGNGLRGYGQLIIIKHSEIYLSAYAHNRRLLVKEGTRVKVGEKIAEMGRVGGNARLHFEIRKAGHPVNPLRYLTRR